MNVVLSPVHGPGGGPVHGVHHVGKDSGVRQRLRTLLRRREVIPKHYSLVLIMCIQIIYIFR